MKLTTLVLLIASFMLIGISVDGSMEVAKNSDLVEIKDHGKYFFDRMMN